MTGAIETTIITVIIFISFVFFIGEPDLHDAMVKWVNAKVTGEQPCQVNSSKMPP